MFFVFGLANSIAWRQIVLRLWFVWNMVWSPLMWWDGLASFHIILHIKTHCDILKMHVHWCALSHALCCAFMHSDIHSHVIRCDVTGPYKGHNTNSLFFYIFTSNCVELKCIHVHCNKMQTICILTQYTCTQHMGSFHKVLSYRIRGCGKIPHNAFQFFFSIH